MRSVYVVGDIINLIDPVRNIVLKAFRLAALVTAAGIATVAHAASFTYNTVFTGTATTCTSSCTGTLASGMGTFTVNAAPSSVGTTTFTAADVTGLSFMVGMSTFTTGLTDIIFTNGALSSIDFSGTVGNRASQRSFTISGLNYSFSAPTSILYDPTSGSVSATAAPTPEPSSLLLLGTGIVGLAGAARRRFLRS